MISKLRFSTQMALQSAANEKYVTLKNNQHRDKLFGPRRQPRPNHKFFAAYFDKLSINYGFSVHGE